MSLLLFFFFNDTATTEIYTLSLHDALPISAWAPSTRARAATARRATPGGCATPCQSSSEASERSYTSQPPSPGLRAAESATRSEEHTSELQSRQYLVCRLLLEKKHNYNTCT